MGNLIRCAFVSILLVGCGGSTPTPRAAAGIACRGARAFCGVVDRVCPLVEGDSAGGESE